MCWSSIWPAKLMVNYINIIFILVSIFCRREHYKLPSNARGGKGVKGNAPSASRPVPASASRVQRPAVPASASRVQRPAVLASASPAARRVQRPVPASASPAASRVQRPAGFSGQYQPQLPQQPAGFSGQYSSGHQVS